MPFSVRVEVSSSLWDLVFLTVPGENVVGNNNTVNITDTGSPETFQTLTLLLYIISSMGGACILIIIVSLKIYYHKRLKVKHKSSLQDPVPTEELQFVAAPGSPKNKIQEDTPTLMDKDRTSVTVEVTYDNAHLGYKSTTQRASDPEEDSIVYADLNYNAKQTGFHFEDNCEVEYATVHLNESRKNDIQE